MTGPATRWVITTLGPGDPAAGELIVQAPLGRMVATGPAWRVNHTGTDQPFPQPFLADAFQRAADSYAQQVEDLIAQHTPPEEPE